MLIIGLTGPSGSGKGYIYQYLNGEGVIFSDTDEVYHGMISRPGECVDALKKEFGAEIINAQGGVDRKKLASIVFSDNSKLERLNSITHTLILERIRQTILVAELQGYKYFIVDAPQLFESGFDKECDYTISVVAPAELRAERVMKRDGITKEKAYERFKNQKDELFFKDNCDFTIINDGRNLHEQIARLKSEIERLYEKKK